MNDFSLRNEIDWNNVMKAERYAGGHEEVMRSLFKNAAVIAYYIEGWYDGDEAFAYQLEDGRIVIVSDSFGSCSGCDAWEGADDTDAKRLCELLADNAHVFNTIEEAIAWCADVTQHAEYYSDRVVSNLVSSLVNYANGESNG